jgi:pseudouridylate synthase
MDTGKENQGHKMTVPNSLTTKTLYIHPEVLEAERKGKPIVALESAVITHGLPRPQNLELAIAMEHEVRSVGAIPATVALLDGQVKIGLTGEELTRLANENNTRKISRRDFALGIARKECGGTTVAGTMIAAQLAGLQVFATGGIGGVHRGSNWDVSADLPELGHTPMVVVCAGAKAILDLPATLEYLETMGVAIIGYQTDEFPAFYSRESGLPVNLKVETPEEIAAIARAQWKIGLQNAILVVNPPPAEAAIPAQQIEGAIQQAVKEAEKNGVHGAALTPFLLSRMGQLTDGASLTTNLALLLNNAHLAAQIAMALTQPFAIRTL